MKLLTSTADILKKINTVESSGRAFQNAVQIAAVSIAAHLAQHRDKTLLEKLWDAMPNGTRRKGMIDWFNHHVTGCEITYKSKLDINLADVGSEEWKGFVRDIDKIIEAMTENPWYNHKEEKGGQDAVSLDAIVSYLERKANAANDSTVSKQIGQVVEFAKGIKTGTA